VSAGSQPDWYIGWLDGALRVMPPLEIRLFHHTIANPFFPGVVMPGITFALLYAWPFLEQRFSKDKAPHNLLDRPRDRPLRTAFGVSTITFYFVLFMAAGTDVFASTFGLSFQSLLVVFQFSLIIAPPLFGWLTWRLLKELSNQRAHPIQQPVGGRIVRTASGGYEVVGGEADGDGPAGGSALTPAGPAPGPDPASGRDPGPTPEPEPAGAATDTADAERAAAEPAGAAADRTPGSP
jgi:ubiquinol-cytochrome c reductase cytochrome b subunit